LTAIVTASLCPLQILEFYLGENKSSKNIQQSMHLLAKNTAEKLNFLIIKEYKYLPPDNQIGAPLYRNELKFDFVPEKIPEIKLTGRKWKYEPSPWFGAFKPVNK
jgi:hypothetical protein